MIKFKFPNIHPKYSFETKPNCKHENIFKMKRNAKLLSNELLTKKNTKCVVRAQATLSFRLSSFLVTPSRTNYDSWQPKSSCMNAI